MKILTLVLSVVVCLPTAAVLHPVLVDPVITRCTDSGAAGACSWAVMYSASGLTVHDTLPLAPPLESAGLELKAMGVHCTYGSATTGVPFSMCNWTSNELHSPTLSSGCKLKDSTSWELDPNSTCSLSRSYWGEHNGAGPGGECVMFVQKQSFDGSGAIRTIYGDLTAEIVANAGSTFCQKALPPSQKCEIDLPAVIDHGNIGPTDLSVISVDGTVDCGAKPVLSVLGGNTVPLGNGVASELTLHLVDATNVHVTSTVTSTNALAGDYNGTHVVIASPY
ncbi:Uncharacterised protein [Serratia fonticola]|nr:Uncharacterised protein [Serratia fonticola]